MKKIMWFLIGFSLVAFPMRLVYATETSCPIPSGLDPDGYQPATWTSGVYVGTYPDNDSAIAAVRAAVGCPSAGVTYFEYNGFFGYQIQEQNSTCTAQVSYGERYYAFIQYGCVLQIPDADDDGIPDDCDFYPEDPEKNNDYKLLHGTREDSSGILVSKYVKTSYGDFFRLGAEVPANTPGYTDELYISSSYETYPSDCIYDISGSSESDFTDPVVYPGGTPDGTPGGTGIDPPMTDGESATGTETESEANTKIIDNTGATADNTAALGEYLKDMNKALQTMDKNIAIQGEAIGEGMDGIQSGLAEISEKMGDGSGDGEAAWDGIDGGSGWDDPALTQITEGETGDYQSHGNLEDEGFISDFLLNNPIKQALDNSGFSLLNPVCQMSFDLGPLGSHTLSICEWDTEITMMGNLFFGITCLMSVMIVARGI
jgi:hypothetical protein